jgi:predicted DNA-binding protein (MmcQ/YjbR family)
MSVRWISRVWEESPYEGRRLLLHLALADFASDEGTCFPSQRTLALKARTTEQWVSTSIRQMVKDGLLEVVARGNGRGNASTYRLLKGQTQFGENDKGETQSPESPNVEQISTYYKNRHEPSIKHDFGFDDFWAKYPRKVAKVAARNVFVNIMKKDDRPLLDDLLKAVDKYAQLGLEIKYVAHPATWLRQQRWLDEMPETSPTPTQKDWLLERAYDKVVPLARLGRTWEDCLDALRDLDERVIEPCREVYLQYCKVQ